MLQTCKGKQEGWGSSQLGLAAAALDITRHILQGFCYSPTLGKHYEGNAQ